MGKKASLLSATLTLALFALVAGCASVSPVGTWVVDVEKTFQAVKTVPRLFKDRFETLEVYKQEVAKRIDGLELTFTMVEFLIHPGAFVWNPEKLKKAVLKKEGEIEFLCWWEFEGKYGLSRGTRVRSVPLEPYGRFTMTGDTAVLEAQGRDYLFSVVHSLLPSPVYLKRKRE